MGLYSPLESSELKLIEALLNLHFCTTIHFWEFSSSSFALGLINTSLRVEVRQAQKAGSLAVPVPRSAAKSSSLQC